MEVKQKKRKYERELLDKKNVWAVSVGFKESRNPFKKILNKIKKFLGIYSIRVWVNEKEPKKDLEEKDLVPKRIEGVRTDVKADTPVEFLNEYRKRHRPIKSGVSMCNIVGTACTSGIPVWRIIDKEIKKGAQVNNHCQVRITGEPTVKGDPVTQPSVFDGGTEEDIVGEVYEWYHRDVNKNNAMDSGWNLLEEGVDMLPKTLKNKYVPEVDSVRPGDKVWKEGRTTGYTEAEVLDVDVTVRVNSQSGVMTFVGQIFTSYLLGAGDSSSAVFKKSNNKVVAQGFAGTENISCLTPYQPILDYFDGFLTREEAEEALNGQRYGYIADGWNDADIFTIFNDQDEVKFKINTFWGMNIRRNPDENSSRIGKAERGEEVVAVDAIKGQNYDWLKIKL